MARSSGTRPLPVARVEDGVVLVDAVSSPDGWVAYGLTKRGLRATQMAHRTKKEAILRLLKEPRVRGMESQPVPPAVGGPWREFLRAAVEGKRVNLSTVPVDDRGWTPFTRRVYRRVRKVAPGRTVTYGQVARDVGSPRAARAVGRAMATNPVAPVVPCHRVVGADGSLCGFSGPGGLRLKEKMLRREGGR